MSDGKIKCPRCSGTGYVARYKHQTGRGRCLRCGGAGRIIWIAEDNQGSLYPDEQMMKEVREIARCMQAMRDHEQDQHESIYEFVGFHPVHERSYHLALQRLAAEQPEFRQFEGLENRRQELMLSNYRRVVSCMRQLNKEFESYTSGDWLDVKLSMFPDLRVV